ncbi:MAG: phage holin family protein [Eubacteriaceae bacterium]|nr:phage holin family protein [Eubacteriaceae bacterium]
MKSIWNAIQVISSTLGAYLGYFLGGWDGFLYALITFVILDYATGVMVAVLAKKLSSEVGFRGIFKKVVIFAIVALAHIIDSEILKSGGTIRTAVVFFYLANEGISILENAGKIGLPVPRKLRNVIEKLNQEEEISG